MFWFSKSNVNPRINIFFFVSGPPKYFCISFHAVITIVSESIKNNICPLQAMFQSGPDASLQEGTCMRTCLARCSLPFSNTRHTWSTEPLPGWPRFLLNRIRYLFMLTYQRHPLFASFFFDNITYVPVIFAVNHFYHRVWRNNFIFNCA